MNADVHIGRLVLEMPGLAEAEARELAARLGQGLAQADVGPHPRLSIALERYPGEPVERLATRILVQLFQQLGRG